MPSMNIREVDVTSLGAFKRKAAAEGLTLRAWVLAVLKVALMDDDGVVSAAETPAPRSAPARQRTQAASPPPQEEQPTRLDLPMIGRRPTHDPKTCRVYRCGACLKVDHHDPHRGL